MKTATQNPMIGEGIYPGPMATHTNATLVDSVTTLLLQWSARSRQRRHLAGLTPSELEDVGISAKAASVEAAKPFWQA